MEKKYISNTILFIFIFLIHYCKNRELETPEEIVKNLNIILNKGFNPNKIIVINKKYYFNITYIKPLLNYTFYTIDIDINIIRPKLILLISSDLYIPYKSKITFCDEKEQYKRLSVNIIVKLNLINILFEQMEDNSYILDYYVKEYSEDFEIKFNYIQNYTFFSNNEITLEEKMNFTDLYFNNIKEKLLEYPECDGYYLFKQMQKYILSNRKFKPLVIDYYSIIDSPEVQVLTYEKYTKVDDIISKFLNVKINLEYQFCGDVSCFFMENICIINEITIFENIITYGKFEAGCSKDEIKLIKKIFEVAKEAVEPLM